MLALDFSLEGHEVVVGLPQIVHIVGHVRVGRELHLEVVDDCRAVFEATEGDFHSLQPLDVEARVGPDPVPLVENLEKVTRFRDFVLYKFHQISNSITKSYLVQLGLLLRRLVGNVVEEVLDLVELGFVTLDLGFELLVVDDQILEGVDVSGQRGFARLDDLFLVLVEGHLEGVAAVAESL